ncbi:MAG: phenylalanine--tRNA ligase subunit alpha [Thermoplasmata archaeon]
MNLSNNEKIIIKVLKENGNKLTIDEIVNLSNLSLVEVMNALSWLKMKGVIKIHEKLNKNYVLTEEGEKALKYGLPEKIFLENVKIGIDDVESLKEKIGKINVNVGIAQLNNRGIKIENGKILVEDLERAEKIVSNNENMLKNYNNLDENSLSFLLKRNLVKRKDSILREAELTEIGKNIKDEDLVLIEEITQITPEHIQKEIWKNANFKKYDVRLFVPMPWMGKNHPLTYFINKVRNIFLSMGFEEIYGRNIVSAFWNMDALYIPQHHPARDMQDTFYLDGSVDIPDYYKIVKNVHENGYNISRGWKYEWDEKEARKLLLRTHTTVNTIKYLYKNRNKENIKAFMVGTVYRRENMDPTHLPEFHQIEGILMEKNSDFPMLLGTLEKFYALLGFEKIKFKPSYFPYTEPSLEIHVEYNGKWIELGGAGIFRPEVTLPMGIKYRVLAWGMGLERLAMIYYNIKNIRDLYLTDIEMLKSLPIP